MRIVEGVTAEPSGNRLVVLNAAGTAISTLNPTAASIWRQLGAVQSFDELEVRVAERYPAVERDELRRDLVEFVDEMADLGLMSRGD